MRRSRLVPGLLAAMSIAGCAALIGEPDPFDYVGGDSDSSTESGGGNDAPSDAPASRDDSAADADASIPVTYHDINDAGSWSAFDLSTIDPRLSGFFGAAFDGRYLYYAPNTPANGFIARYDTQGAFDAVGSWTLFDVSSLGVGDVRFAGAVFTGGAVYFVPHQRKVDGSFTAASVIVRLDTSDPSNFTTTAPWLTFDLGQSVSFPSSGGFFGGTFDGRYVHFTPWAGGTPAVRYDSQLAFQNAGSYEAFDPISLDAGNGSWLGAVFDGKDVSYLPIFGPALHLTAAGNFNAVSSWKTFPVAADASLASDRIGGGTFDGRYVYGPPGFGQGGVFFRWDSTGDFADAASWTSRAFPDKFAAYFGSVFDGRYVYLVPGSNGGDVEMSTVVRYDTQSDFGSSVSYTSFVTTALGPNAKGFGGGAFDGRYVYLVPLSGSVAVRFDAKTPASMPAAYHGSFL